MAILQWKNCSFDPWGEGYGLKNVSLSINRGDVVAIVSDTNEDAHLLLRCMASLECPTQGAFLYKDNPLDCSDYRKLLKYKTNVGYIASDAAVFANRTLGENLLFHRRYFHDDTSQTFDAETEKLFTHLQIAGKLKLQPAQAYAEDIRLTIVVRELRKEPDILLVERPGDDMDYDSMIQFLEIIELVAAMGTPVVFYSFNQEFIRRAANRQLWICKGKVEIGPY